jgi:hypothetical protein
LQTVLLPTLDEVSDKKLKVVQNDRPFLAMEFLGAFAKLRKAITSFVMSVCQFSRPSIRMGQMGMN